MTQSTTVCSLDLVSKSRSLCLPGRVCRVVELEDMTRMLPDGQNGWSAWPSKRVVRGARSGILVMRAAGNTGNTLLIDNSMPA